jgi:hypothetical protein
MLRTKDQSTSQTALRRGRDTCGRMKVCLNWTLMPPPTYRLLETTDNNPSIPSRRSKGTISGLRHGVSGSDQRSGTRTRGGQLRVHTSTRDARFGQLRRFRVRSPSGPSSLKTRRELLDDERQSNLFCSAQRRPYLRIVPTNRSWGNACATCPSRPIIVSAATRALPIASLVASTVAWKKGSIATSLI